MAILLLSFGVATFVVVRIVEFFLRKRDRRLALEDTKQMLRDVVRESRIEIR